MNVANILAAAIRILKEDCSESSNFLGDSIADKAISDSKVVKERRE